MFDMRRLLQDTQVLAMFTDNKDKVLTFLRKVSAPGGALYTNVFAALDDVQEAIVQFDRALQVIVVQGFDIADAGQLAVYEKLELPLDARKTLAAAAGASENAEFKGEVDWLSALAQLVQAAAQCWRWWCKA